MLYRLDFSHEERMHLHPAWPDRSCDTHRLGLHLTELAAAKAYDRVAIKKWGPDEAANKINFPLSQYNLAELEAMDMSDLVTTVRGNPYPPLPSPPALRL